MARSVLLAVAALGFLAAGCAGAEGATSRDWAGEVQDSLSGDGVAQDVIDCVLNVARVELERNPLSEDATDELIQNCQAARAVIEEAGEEPTPQLPMADEPWTFGDDPALDGLWTACEEGSGAACDQLFGAAPVGSGYEDFGVSCGNRPEVLYCDDLDLDADLDPDVDLVDVDG